MTRFRNYRGPAALGLLVGVMLLLVLPAIASTPGQAVPPASQPAGVTPIDVGTGGQPNDCAIFYPAGTTLHQFYVSNPKSRTYTDSSTGATFTLTLDPTDQGTSWPAYAKDKYLSFATTGAAVVDVGIDGGNDTTRYRYGTDTTAGYVKADGYLHAPAQSVDSSGQPTQLYSISHLTLCYSLLTSISGAVYQDANQNGTNDTGDSALAGWTVRLYNGSNAVDETTSGPDGSYRFDVPVGPTYTVCEAPPSGTWAESQPLPASPNLCSGTGELTKGYSVPATSTQAITGKDFGNAPAVPGVCGAPFGDPGYTIQTATCKASVGFVFSTDTSSSGPSHVSVWAGDQTNPVPMVEKIVFPDPIVNGQPTYTKLLYTDTFPFLAANEKTLPYCLLDPRDGTEFGLQSAYSSSLSSAVVPSGNTSCAISIETSVTAGGSGQMLAYVYSAADGLRTTG